MFKKYYKEANDDIKPSEEFISDVIKKAKKGKPPAYKRYAKYAAAAAAAVIVVSGAVLSMPMWKSVDEDNGVIFEETTDSKAPSSPSPASAGQTPTPTAQIDGAAGAVKDSQKEKSNNLAVKQQSPTSKPQSQAAPPSTRAGIASSFNSSAQSQEAKKTEETNKANNTHEEERASDISERNVESNPQPTASEEVKAEEMNKALPTEESTEENSVVADLADTQAREYKVPEDTAAYEEKKSVSAAPADKGISDSDIPAPTGYYCVSATARGYTFQNDEGAVIEVTISYGGEEREPYIEEDGDSIYAVFTSYGMSVTINAYGAQRASVEEIINQLR